MHLLIPYIQLDEVDPDLDEFSYGDAGARGKKLLTKVHKGDYVFFHTTINRSKCITAYYVVDRTLRVADARGNQNIMRKYKNPHLHRGRALNEFDMVLFGDPIESRRLERPLPLNRRICGKLGLKIQHRKGFSEAQIIGSATRSWRELKGDDVNLLLCEIEKEGKRGIDKSRVLTTEEVMEIIEKDLENFVTQEHGLFGGRFEFAKRQLDTPAGRMDLLYEDKRGNCLVVELKMGRIGRDAVNQLHRYMNHIEKTCKGTVRGVIVCEGVLPAFEEEFANGMRKISIFTYGWRLAVKKW